MTLHSTHFQSWILALRHSVSVCMSVSSVWLVQKCVGSKIKNWSRRKNWNHKISLPTHFYLNSTHNKHVLKHPKCRATWFEDTHAASSEVKIWGSPWFRLDSMWKFSHNLKDESIGSESNPALSWSRLIVYRIINSLYVARMPWSLAWSYH